ncbi:DNA alkylation repair protein [Nannocystis sp.]|uniref:DNA alkylation repair protein n=1 Tax=Nannocystis sp. TaxID=1962667 RepID=UPI002429076B|nr:DNA alkylation repair protein [Nannocystis sp.]MBK7829060.1 DNA alkylation repair protein [Nannocystis sp.]MBK9757546.1 DNA alkylation repair protein [Nannocystis sp.]
MPAARTTTTTKVAAKKPAAARTTKVAAKQPAARTTKVAAKQPAAPAPRMTLAEAMHELEQAGSAQTRKTYARHGATGPMFGVSFAALKLLHKRIGVDHELACALWDTGNFDARNLAVKVVDPARMSSAELDRWAREAGARSCGGYVAMLAAEGPHAAAKAATWLARDAPVRPAGWTLVGQLAQRDEAMPDAWFKERLAEIEATIDSVPNAEREAMHLAVITIGCRNPALRKAATAAAKRIGKVEVDHGDTACKTPDAAAAIDKAWAHSLAKGFASPAAHERTREPLRLRC